MTRWTISRLLAVTADYLEAKGCDSPRLDAELLLGRALGVERVELYTQHDRPLCGEELDTYRELVSRRAKREPVAYILGNAAFRYLELEVTPAVLIPRPETEELVEAALDRLKQTYLPGDRTEPLIADVGTGSGAIALSLAREAGVRVLARDCSGEALAVAERNRQSLALDDRVILEEADLLDGVADDALRMVICNPPYVAAGDLRGLEPEVSFFEPAGALEAGPDGLDVYRRLVPEAGRALGPGGAMMLEVGAGQAQAVTGLAEDAGFVRVEVVKDLAGHKRIVQAVRPGALELSLEDALSPEGAGRLRAVLREGAILGVPTDTVPGLAAGWRVNSGVRRLFTAKGREGGRPLAVLFSSAEAVKEALPAFPVVISNVLHGLLPGPYTFVVPAPDDRPPGVGTGQSLGVRVPDYPELLSVLETLGMPLAATSANPTGAPAASCWEEVPGEILSHCAAVLLPGKGANSVGVASSVVDLCPLVDGGEARVLREGAIPAGETLSAVRKLAGR